MLDPSPGIADVGVVVVHGIGEQREGETLGEYGEAIVDYARERAELVGVELEVGATEDQLLMQWTEGGSSRRVQISEAWWADVFEPPEPSRVIGWSALVGVGWSAVRERTIRRY